METITQDTRNEIRKSMKANPDLTEMNTGELIHYAEVLEQHLFEVNQVRNRLYEQIEWNSEVESVLRAIVDDWSLVDIHHMPTEILERVKALGIKVKE